MTGEQSEQRVAQAAAQVQVSAGHLDDAELAAVAVALAAVNVASQVDAAERALRTGAGQTAHAWTDRAHSLRSGHTLRTQASPHAWTSSHR